MAMGGRFSAHGQFLFHRLRRFARVQIQIDLLGSRIAGHIRRPAEVGAAGAGCYTGRKIEFPASRAWICLPSKVTGFAFRQAPPDARW